MRLDFTIEMGFASIVNKCNTAYNSSAVSRAFTQSGCAWAQRQLEILKRRTLVYAGIRRSTASSSVMAPAHVPRAYITGVELHRT